MSSCKATESFCFVHTTQYIYEEDNKNTLELLGRQATFKFRALWSVRDGKGLMFHMQLHDMEFISADTVSGVAYVHTVCTDSPHANTVSWSFPLMLTNVSDQDPTNVSWTQTNISAGSW